jgi:1-acyl-sn-glycerol-3-phosphate acyltransferase
MIMFTRVLLWPFKFLTIFALIFLFLSSGAITALFIRDKWKLKKALNHVVSFYCKLGLKVINVDVIVNGSIPNNENFLYVSNHQSYMDILVMTSVFPSSFVTSLDIKRMPLLGQITMLAGCLFVDRKSRVNLQNEIAELTEGLKSGLDVTIFPEATSTDGSTIIRFRRPLFSAAVFAGKRILPMLIRYKSINHRLIDINTRDIVCWYGDMTFVGNLAKLLFQHHITVELSFFAPIEAQNIDAADLAEQTHALLLNHYKPY